MIDRLTAVVFVLGGALACLAASFAIFLGLWFFVDVIAGDRWVREKIAAVIDAIARAFRLEP